MGTRRAALTLLLITCTVISNCVTTATAQCILKEPRYNGTFDLSGLQSTHAHTYSVPHAGDFTFNLCGGVNPTTCNGVAGTGACFKDAATGKERILGYASSNPVMRDSIIYFTFAGEKCAEKTDKNYTMEVMVECDYANEPDPISLIRHVDCEFLLRYRSQKACMQTTGPRSSCVFQVANNTRTINLATLPKGNQRVVAGDLEFFVSVCRPVIYTPTSACPPDTNVCVYDKKKKDFLSIGGPKVTILHETDEFVSLNYTSNMNCDADATRKVSSIINLKCDPTQSNKISYLGPSGCTHNFEWFTPEGCDTKSTCQVYDPSKDVTYNMTPLKNRTFVASRGGTNYTFGVCQAPKECGLTQGACDNRPVGFGKANSVLNYNETGYPFLKYDGGAECNVSKWYTKIEFTCAVTVEEEGVATVVEDSNCRLLIQLATRHACDHQISCKDSYNGEDYDLRPLMNNEANYVAEVDEELVKGNRVGKDEKFYINVCRALVPQFELHCDANAAVCKASVIDGKPVNETSLGFPDVSLTVVNSSGDGEATPQLKYLRGSACADHPGENASSLIHFKCNAKAGRGRPVLKSIDDECTYHFEWETNTICKDSVAEFGANCAVTNKDTGYSLDLKKLGTDGLVDAPSIGNFSLCDLKDVETAVDYSSQMVFLRAKKMNEQKERSVEVVLQCRGVLQGLYANPNHEDELYNITVRVINPAVCQLFEAPDAVIPTVPPAPSATTTTTTTVKPTDKSTEAPASKTPTSGGETSSTTTTSTEKPPVDPGNANATGTTVTPSEKAPTPAEPEKGGMSGWGVTVLIFFLCTVVLVAAFIVRSPHRRAQVMSLFRRKNVAVSYTRDFDEPYYSI